jgi:hypothetical protein
MFGDSLSGAVHPAASSERKPRNTVAYLSRLAKKRARIEAIKQPYDAAKRRAPQYAVIRRRSPQLPTFIPP